MTDMRTQGGVPAQPVNLLPYQDLIKPVAVEDVFGWLAKGWRDFKAGGLVSLAYGAIFVAALVVLVLLGAVSTERVRGWLGRTLRLGAGDDLLR